MTSVAVIGAGYWGRNLVRTLNDLEVLALICDVSEAAAAAASKGMGIALTADADAVLLDPEIDAVVLATPAQTHQDLAERAIAAGKHVLVEKPISLDAAGARRLVRNAAARGVVLMVGHVLRYHPAFRALHRLVQQGRLGRLRHIRSHRFSLGKLRTAENVLWSFMPHDVSMALALSGEMPTTVEAFAEAHVTPGVADVATAQLNFGNGVSATLAASWIHPFKEHRLVVVGEHASAVFDDVKPWPEKLIVLDHRIEQADGELVAVKAEGVAIQLEPAEPLREECAHFLSACANRTKPLTDGHEGVAALDVLTALDRSIQSKSTVTL